MEAAGGAGGERRALTLSLSNEHNPTIYEERMRIQRAGGTVRYANSQTVLRASIDVLMHVCRCVPDYAAGSELC